MKPVKAVCCVCTNGTVLHVYNPWHIYMHTDLNFYLFCPHFQKLYGRFGRTISRTHKHARTYTHATDRINIVRQIGDVFPVLC